MKLDNRTKELIAVGTAIGANCYPCLGWYVSKARAQGIPDDEIAAAIEVGKLVRQGAHGNMDKRVSELLGQVPCTPAAAGCGCQG
ncbi:MAG: carboxymuconolactone decarboxylase family protein [Gammaproteobacteria bacterium]|nr:carboxymuconolactone decarboxylase family protein [Gammaproteobacteria bacterium]MDH5513151.1 carboxymuconolactone decarboxylase family protein [Gammaproteobacteria bacterium]